MCDHFFLGSRMDARWQEVWHRHENKSRDAVARELAARIFFSRSDDNVAFCFLRCRAVATAVAVARAASCGMQRAPINAHMFAK